MFKTSCNLRQILSDETIFNPTKLAKFRKDESNRKKLIRERRSKLNQLWEQIDPLIYNRDNIDFVELLDNPNYDIEQHRFENIYNNDYLEYKEYINNFYKNNTVLEENSIYEDFDYHFSSDGESE